MWNVKFNRKTLILHFVYSNKDNEFKKQLLLKFIKVLNLRGSFFMFVESGCISTNIEFTVPYVYIF